MTKKRLSASLEDYLEAIYTISRDKFVAHANKIAKNLGVRKSSVSWALNQLSEKGLINYRPYEAISLTEQGLQQARQISSRHQQIQRFLEDVLGINPEQAESNACRMEHVVDPAVLDRMKQFIHFLESDPKKSTAFLSVFRQFSEERSPAKNSTGAMTTESPKESALKADDTTTEVSCTRHKATAREIRVSVKALGISTPK